MRVRFGILGPVEAWDGDRRLAIGGPQQRGLLAVLLLHANRVVSADLLVDALWGADPPDTARGLLQGCVAGLRRALRAPAGDGGRLATIPPGYRLRVDPGELDLHRFEQLAGEAEAVRAADPVRAAALLEQALSLWRGPVLGGVTIEGCRADATRLAERRLAVLAQRVDVDLWLGRRAELVGELSALVEAHPLRERSWAQLMLALHAADRRADALDAYQRLRRTLVEQLGLEPGPTIRQLHRSILAGEDPLPGYLRSNGLPASAAPAAPAAPAEPAPAAQLPPAPAGFVGRRHYHKRLDELLADTDRGPRIATVSGMAGVGKTALAVHWAHRVRAQFPHGQLYVNLRGYASPPVRPIEALAGFLQALGVPADRVPVDLEQAAALYRSLLADRRVLVVLDNAYRIDQVRPLLPGGEGCLVLVTSRERLGGLVAREGAVHIDLDVLDPDEAGELLARLLGQDRVQAEALAAADLARLCAFLPLALRVVAANLTVHPRLAIADQMAALAAGDRLAALAVDRDEQAAVRAAFDQSYAALPADAGRLFRLLGLAPGPHVTVEAAAALAGTARLAAARLLDRLADGHLLDEPVPGRYAMHDLVRLYAADRVRREDTVDDHGAATDRLYDWYLRTADTAAAVLHPEKLRLPLPAEAPAGTPEPLAFAGHAQALAWLDAELPNLVAAIRSAATGEPRPVAWRLPSVLYGYFYSRMYRVDWLAAASAGLSAAEAAGDLPGQAAQLLSLGALRERTGDYPAARDLYTRALAISQQTGWLELQAAALASLGIVHRRAGRLEVAADHFTRALRIDRRAGWPPGIVTRLVSLGNIHAELGQLATAAEHYTDALAINSGTGSRSGEAVLRANLGQCCLMLGRLDDAVDMFTAALALNRDIGNRGLVADNHRALATAHRDAGRLPLALECAGTAVALAQETGDRRYEADALNALGTVCLRLGRADQALDHHQAALALAREIGEPLHETAALVGLSTVHTALGQAGTGLARATEAVALAERYGYRLLVGPAGIALAAAQLAAGRADRAAEAAARAVDECRATGQRLDEAQAQQLLDRARSWNSSARSRG